MHAVSRVRTHNLLHKMNCLHKRGKRFIHALTHLKRNRKSPKQCLKQNESPPEDFATEPLNLRSRPETYNCNLQLRLTILTCSCSAASNCFISKHVNPCLYFENSKSPATRCNRSISQRGDPQLKVRTTSCNKNLSVSLDFVQGTKYF